MWSLVSQVSRKTIVACLWQWYRVYDRRLRTAPLNHTVTESVNLLWLASIEMAQDAPALACIYRSAFNCVRCPNGLLWRRCWWKLEVQMENCVYIRILAPWCNLLGLLLIGYCIFIIERFFSKLHSNALVLTKKMWEDFSCSRKFRWANSILISSSISDISQLNFHDVIMIY